MSLRTDIRDFAAKAFYDALVAGLGEQWTYTNRGSAVTLWVLPEGIGESRMRGTLGTRTLENHGTVSVPKQTSFPPTAGVMADDTLTDGSSNVYAIREWSFDSVGAICKFTDVVQSLAKQSGAVGQ